MVCAAMKSKDACSLEGKRLETRQCIQKQRRHFASKGLYTQSYRFSCRHVCYECWTIKKAKHWRIDSFELWCWRRLLRVPWTAMRSNQSILKEINPEYSLEELMLNEAEAPIFWPCDVKSWLIGEGRSPKYWERLKAKGEGSGRWWDG